MSNKINTLPRLSNEEAYKIYTKHNFSNLIPIIREKLISSNHLTNEESDMLLNDETIKKHIIAQIKYLHKKTSISTDTIINYESVTSKKSIDKITNFLQDDITYYQLKHRPKESIPIEVQTELNQYIHENINDITKIYTPIIHAVYHCQSLDIDDDRYWLLIETIKECLYYYKGDKLNVLKIHLEDELKKSIKYQELVSSNI